MVSVLGSSWVLYIVGSNPDRIKPNTIKLVFVVIFASTPPVCASDAKGVSEWLLFNANSAIIQLYHGENKLIFDENNYR
jgi:hypothetical protein